LATLKKNLGALGPQLMAGFLLLALVVHFTRAKRQA
jgi:hypothetical protein